MLDEELATVKYDIKKSASDMNKWKNDLLDPNEVLEKILELEDRSQRNDPRIEGLTGTTNKT